MPNEQNEKSEPILFAQERQDRIISMLQEQSKLHVANLCDTFNVSPATIRNDLRELESQGKLRRTHGGALPVEKANFEPKTADKSVTNIDVKNEIALCAASLIDDGDTIVLDSGTTLLELAKCISDKRGLTVLTNDIRIVTHLEQFPGINILLIGGTVRNGYDCTVGPIAISCLSSLTVDKAFLGTNAFSIEKGFSTPDINQAEIKKAFINCATERIMLCDSSKFGHNSLVAFATFDDVERIVTDQRINKKLESFLNENYNNIELIIC